MKNWANAQDASASSECPGESGQSLRYLHTQGRRRVLKSGPAEEIIECRRGELGGLPRENFEFLALLCAFLMGFYAFGTRFQSRILLDKIFLGA